MIFPRKQYIEKLMEARGDGMVKVISGPRCCGKSFLLHKLFYEALIKDGAAPENIIALPLAGGANESLRDPDAFLDFIDSGMKADGQVRYLLLDDVQLLGDTAGVLLSLIHRRNLEVYCAGTGVSFLTYDAVTEFRGRAREIRLFPLSFREFYEAAGGDRQERLNTYLAYGGMPQVLLQETGPEMRATLRHIYDLTCAEYYRDRVKVRRPEVLHKLELIFAREVGKTFNVERLGQNFKEEGRPLINRLTLKEYLGLLKQVDLIEEIPCLDVKKRRPVSTEHGFYFTDLGIRSACRKFRRKDEPQVLQTVIYNELRSRGFEVACGRFERWHRGPDNSRSWDWDQIDFVADLGPERVYIQTVWQLHTSEEEEKKRALSGIGDSFPKVIITGDNIKRKTGETGIITLSLAEFLLGGFLR